MTDTTKESAMTGSRNMDSSRASDAPKARWMVRLPGRRPFPMLGEPIDRAEALRCARLIWPNAEVE